MDVHVMFNCIPNNTTEIGHREQLWKHKKMHGKAELTFTSNKVGKRGEGKVVF